MKLKRVSRLDNMPLTAAYFTPEGYLRDKPIVTTCGIFEYQNDDGSIRRELRLPADVFDPESLKSYKGKPIIFTHDAGEIDAGNVSQEITGTILSNGIKDGANVRADIIIHDAAVLKRGLRELSLGYDCDLEETPGVWQGKPYDAIQHNIRINHLALVEQARAGHKARLNLDGKSKGGKTKMKTKKKRNRIDGADLTPEQLEAAIAMYMAANAEQNTDDDNEEETDPIEQIRQNADRRDEDIASVDPEEIPVMQEEIKTLLAEVDKLNGANDMTADEDDDPENQNTDDDDDTDDQNMDEDDDPENQNEDDDDTEAPAEDTSVKMDSVERNWAEMYSICQMASKLGFDGFVPKSVMDGKKKIIRAVNPKMKLDGKSREYINGAYQIAAQQAMNRKTVADNMRKALGNKSSGRLDSAGGVSAAEGARQRMIANMKGKKGE